MEDETVTISIDLPPVLHGYVCRLVASGKFIDEGDAIRHLLRKEFFDNVGDPMELRGLVEKKPDRLTKVTHPNRCALCEE